MPNSLKIFTEGLKMFGTKNLIVQPDEDDNFLLDNEDDDINDLLDNDDESLDLTIRIIMNSSL